MNIVTTLISLLFFQLASQTIFKHSISSINYLAENHQIKPGQLSINEQIQVKVKPDLADIQVILRSSNSSQPDAQNQLKYQTQQMIQKFRDRKIVYNIAMKSQTCFKSKQIFNCVSVYTLSINRINLQRINNVIDILNKLKINLSNIHYKMSSRRKYQYRNAILQIVSRRSSVQANKISKLIGKPIQGIKFANYYDYLRQLQPVKIDQQKQFLTRNTMTYRINMHIAYFLDNK